MKRFLDTMGIRVKVNNNFGGIVIFHEEYICNLRDTWRVYDRGTYTRICIGAWAQQLSPLIGVNYVNFESPDENVYEWNFVEDVYKGEELNANHIIYVLVGAFFFFIDWRGITVVGINNNSMVNA